MASVGKNFCITILVLLVLSGCGDSGSTQGVGPHDPQPVPLTALKLQQSGNCDELKNYVVTSLIERYTAIPRNSYYSCPVNYHTGDQAPIVIINSPEVRAGGNAQGVPSFVSDTNNQEQGVNEADIVKADDNGIVYALSGRHLIVAKGFPPQELTTLKELDLGAHGTQLFLDKSRHRLVVLARYDSPVSIIKPVVVAAAQDPAIFPPIENWDTVVAVFYDVSTPDNPVMLNQIRFKGYYQDGRRIGQRLHLVLRNYYYPEMFYQDPEVWRLRGDYWQTVRDVQCENPGAGPGEVASHPAVVAAKEAFAARVRAVFEAVSIEQYLPTAQRQTPQGGLQPLPFLACSDINHPQVSASLGLQVIASIDTDGQNLDATAIVDNAQLSYVSEDNLYVAETSWHWWWLAQDGTGPTTQTAIYKFAISGDKPNYVATGTVDGIVRDQFGLSEYNGALRVATNQNDVYFDAADDGSIVTRWEQQNNLFVMGDDNDGNLTLSGAVRGFGKNESLQSSRFLGARGFVATSRQIDPLFTFDLSDPANPQLMGELTIPGFTQYMHLYDQDHVITIARDGNAIQLQLFDVSDLSDPKLLHTYTPASGQWSWSMAEYDPKAFTFYKPANLLAIPVQQASDTGSVFSGVVAYTVSLETGFDELGRVDHSNLAYEYYCNSGVELLPEYAPYCTDGMYLYWAAPRRSFVMTSEQDVYLYTLSDMGMKASDIKDLNAELGNIEFPPQPYPWWYYITLNLNAAAN